LRHAWAADKLTELLARDPVAHADLTDPSGAPSLLYALRHAGAADAATALATRAAAHADLSQLTDTVATVLINALRDAGADDAVVALVGRADDGGLFQSIRAADSRIQRLRFGREPDRRPSERWGWDDLG